MNMEFVMWVGGILLTLGCVKVVWSLFRSIFNKDSINGVINGASKKITQSGERAIDRMKKKSEERKQRKAEENKAIAFIR